VIREDGQRFATVLSNVRGRDLVGFVDEAKAANRRERSVSLRDLAGRGNPASLAIVVIGGLVTSTTLTLIHRERHGRNGSDEIAAARADSEKQKEVAPS
jgi:Cu/Ag efflux pump CusA